jgi:hypothetical protein
LRGNFVVAAHLEVGLTPRFLRALHLELFAKPSNVMKRFGARSRGQGGIEHSPKRPAHSEK